MVNPMSIVAEAEEVGVGEIMLVVMMVGFPALVGVLMALRLFEDTPVLLSMLEGLLGFPPPIMFELPPPPSPIVSEALVLRNEHSLRIASLSQTLSKQAKMKKRREEKRGEMDDQ